MMNERETDRLLGELFKRNAPYVSESALQRRISRALPRRRRRSRKNRAARAVAVGFASVVLLGGALYGAYRVVDYLRGQAPLAITDSTLSVEDVGPASPGAAGTSAVGGLVPIVGTATLEEVRSEGTSAHADYLDYSTVINGRVCEYAVEMSQRQISGTLEITSDIEEREDSSADVSATWVLSNDDGTWRCDYWVGYLTADATEEFGFGSAVGTGDYEGLELYLQWHSAKASGSASSATGAAESARLTGWIQSAD